MKKSVLPVVILLLAVLVLWLFARPDSASWNQPELVRFDPASVDSIRLSGEGVKELLLHREEMQWLMQEGQRADRDAVDHLLNDLASMEVVRVVTRNSEHYPELGIGEDAVRVVLSGAGSDLLTVEIGKQGGDLLSTYLRMAGKNEVVAVNKTLVWQVRRAKEGWKAVETPVGAEQQ